MTDSASHARRVNRAALILSAVATVIILVSTLTPYKPDQPLPTRVCLFCGPVGGLDFTNNVLLFAPLGAGLALLGLRRSRALLAGFLLSLTIELLQYRVIPGRYATVGDVVWNTFGVGVGFFVAVHARWWLAPRGKRATVIAVVAAVAWLGQLILTTWGLRPAPGTTNWVAMSRRGPPSFAPYDGALLQWVLNGDSAPAALLPGPEPIRYRNRARITAVDARFTASSTRPDRVASIMEMRDWYNQGFLLGRDDDDLVVRSRQNAGRLRLRQLTLKIPSLFSRGRAGDTVFDAHLRHTARSMHLRIDGMAPREVVVELAPTMGWVLFSPLELPAGRHDHLYSGAWVLGWITLLAYFVLRSQDGTRRIAPALALGAPIVAGLVAVPLIAGSAFPNAWEWLGAVCGVALGGAFVRLSRGIETRDVASDAGA